MKNPIRLITLKLCHILGESADSLTVLIGEHNWSPKNNLKVAINEAHEDFCDQGCG